MRRPHPREHREIRVECYAGYKAEQEPRVLHVDDQEMRVLGIADRWYDPSASYFKVRAEDGHQYLLRHDRARDAWTLVRRFEADA